jgi:hypothetical protein
LRYESFENRLKRADAPKNVVPSLLRLARQPPHDQTLQELLSGADLASQ